MSKIGDCLARYEEDDFSFIKKIDFLIVFTLIENIVSAHKPRELQFYLELNVNLYLTWRSFNWSIPGVNKWYTTVPLLCEWPFFNLTRRGGVEDGKEGGGLRLCLRKF
jgi:hypothetical protein